jgi:hypothetical protein
MTDGSSLESHHPQRYCGILGETCLCTKEHAAALLALCAPSCSHLPFNGSDVAGGSNWQIGEQCLRVSIGRQQHPKAPEKLGGLSLRGLEAQFAALQPAIDKLVDIRISRLIL